MNTFKITALKHLVLPGKIVAYVLIQGKSYPYLSVIKYLTNMHELSHW